MTIAQQVSHITANAEMSMKAREFVNLARAIALSRGIHSVAQQLMHDNRILMGPRVKSIIDSHHSVYQFAPDTVHRQKAAISAGTTADSGWALPLVEYNTLASAFPESLRRDGKDAVTPEPAEQRTVRTERSSQDLVRRR